MAVVKGEVEFIRNVFGRNGIEPNTGTKFVEIVNGAYLRRRPTLNNDFAGLTLGPGRAWSINQHVGTPPTSNSHPNMRSNLYKPDKMKPVLWRQRFMLLKPNRSANIKWKLAR
jgi:hypothetical protein